jgi:hypothetical protein
MEVLVLPSCDQSGTRPVIYKQVPIQLSNHFSLLHNESIATPDDEPYIDTINSNTNTNTELHVHSQTEISTNQLPKHLQSNNNGNSKTVTNTCIYTNADSLINKKAELETLVQNIRPAIILITEALPKNTTINISELQIDEYQLSLNNKPSRGVIIYTHVSLNAQSCDILNDDDFTESVWSTWTTQQKERIIIGCIYRSPSSDGSNNKNLLNLLQKVDAANTDHILIVGDFNYPSINWNTGFSPKEEEDAFLNTTSDIFLQQLVTNPTRHRINQTSNLLDLVLTNNENIVNEITHLPPLGKSDHDILQISLHPDILSTSKQIAKPKLLLNKGRYNELRRDLGTTDWNHLHQLNASEAWNFLHKTLNTVKEQYIPTTKNHGKKKHLWIDRAATDSLNSKKRAYKRYNETKKTTDYTLYKIARNKATACIGKSKQTFERKVATESKKNPKAFWNYVKSKTVLRESISKLRNPANDTMTTDDTEKANILNTFFSNMFTPENLLSTPIINPRNNGTILKDILITPIAIENKLKGLNPNKSNGPDEIPVRILKEAAKEISTPLCIIFNKSLEEGILPDIWKMANVCCIHKKGSKNDPSNYRPISLTSTLCKVLESFIRDSIVNFLETANLFTKCQHGFRRKRSCKTQLLEYLEDLTAMLDSNEPVDAIYLDFSKAFDTVPHQRLQTKLRSYGIGENLVKWIGNYLSNRSQRVRINDASSDWIEVTSGVPQGSVLGPILFLIYINDLPDRLTCHCKIFADDTKMYGNPATSQIQENINKVCKWSQTWQLSFNTDKTHVMHFGRNNPQTKYYMTDTPDPHPVSTSDVEKDLGVHVDRNLSFDIHIGNIVSKANSTIGLIKRTFTNIDQSTFTLLYKSLVRPILEYCNSAWSPRLKRQSQLLERVQRRATKLVPQIREYSYTERLEALNLMSLKYRRFRGDLIETFKLIKDLYNIDNTPSQIEWHHIGIHCQQQ